MTIAITDQDIKSDKWLALVVRMRRLAKTQYVNKCKLIRLTVITADDGTPLIWTEPECVPIEPGEQARHWLNQL